MSDDYLWDRSGEPDPEVVRLEALLSPLGHRPGQFARPAFDVGRRTPATEPVPRHHHAVLVALGLAATIVLMVTGTWWAGRSTDLHIWTVEPLQGAPTMGRSRVSGQVPMRPDTWLTTDARSGARVTADEVGVVEIGPDSRVRLGAAREGEHRLDLEHGRLSAFIWAPPGRFYVSTPAATAIDLGCAYTLAVARDGQGRLRVSAGWVGLAENGHESLVPAGAACAIRPGLGPGIPYFEDAPRPFVDALAALNAGETGGTALDAVLQHARERDALTLWHLLSRVGAPQRTQVYDKLAAMAPPPSGVSRKAVLAADRQALRAWWDSLDLGDASLFRFLDLGKAAPAAGAAR